MKKSWKITIVIVLLFLIARELSSYSFSFYKNYSKTNSTANSTFRSWKAGEIEAIEKSSISLDENESPTIIFYGFDKELDYSIDSFKNKENCVKVFIENDTYIGLTRYIPLVKPIDFHSNISYSWKYTLNKNNMLTNIEGSGSINTTGSNTIYGICSGKEAEKLITLKITENVKQTITSDVKNKLKSI